MVDRREAQAVSPDHPEVRPPDALAGARSIGAAMSDLARTLQREHASEDDTLAAVTTAAVHAVPGAEHAAISLVVDRKTVQSQAATGPLPRQVDHVQTAVNDGPCLTSAWEHETVRIDDMATEKRWPRFATEAADAGVGSMLCFQLFVSADNLGALNLYARAAHAFDAESESIGLILATHAAVAIAGARQEGNLSTALAHRDLIGQAKGIVMERYQLDATHAFGLISRLSQEMNIKLRDLAEKIVDDVSQSSSD